MPEHADECLWHPEAFPEFLDEVLGQLCEIFLSQSADEEVSLDGLLQLRNVRLNGFSVNIPLSSVTSATASASHGYVAVMQSQSRMR